MSLVLLFLHQLKCLFSVNFPYLFYDVTCCETAGCPPHGDRVPERATLVIAFPYKMLKTNKDMNTHTEGNAVVERSVQ